MNPRAEPPDVARLLAQQSLQRVNVNHRGASASLMRARRLLASARTVIEDDPDTAYVLADFRLLRRRRDELEHPAPSGPESVDDDEAQQALRSAAATVESAEALLPTLRSHGT